MRAEADFIIQRNGRLISIEVRSADNTRAKSLKLYIELFKPDCAIKLSSKKSALKKYQNSTRFTPCFVFKSIALRCFFR